MKSPVRKLYPSTLLGLLGLAGLLGLSACGQQDAQAPDESLTSEVRRQEQSAMHPLPAADEMRSGLDAAITGRVQAALGQDVRFKDLEVQTRQGHVVLNGLVPDETARQRAAELAGGVEGVVALDNRLQVGPSR